MPRRLRPRRGRGIFLLLVPVIAVLLATAVQAQEKKISLVFTKELLSQIAADNQGELTGKIVDRIIGLSPEVLNVRVERPSVRVSLYITTMGGADEFPVSFQFTLDKMTYYRIHNASADLPGITEALQDAKAVEPLLLSVGYRYDGRYSIVDLVIDLRPAIKTASEMQSRRQVEDRAAAAAKATADARAAAEAAKSAEMARVAAAAKSAEEVRTAAAAKAAEDARAAAAEKAAEEARSAAAAKAAAKTAAAEKSRQNPVESAPPPKDVIYLSAKGLGRERPPIIDGQSSDAAWQIATPLSFEVNGASGKMEVTAEAVWSSDRFWILVRWPDKTKDDVHRPWVWSKAANAYVAGREVEDALSLSFAREGRMGECMLAGGEAVTDIWTWRAGRTNPSGFAEDGTMTLSFQRIPRANSYQTHNGRSVWIKEEPDAGSPPYQAQIVGAYAGERIPRYIARTPSGSMADVTAKGSWKDGFWTVEFSRRLSTGDPADAVLAPGREIYFSVAVFNSREGIDHSTSKEFTLKLE